MIQLGEINIHLVSDGVVHVDGGGPFGLVPRTLWSRYLSPDDHNRVPMILTCLLVEAGGKKILVDTGLGDKLPPKMVEQWGLIHPTGDLIDGLARLGVTPDDIDIVINTHLHGDHCAGNTAFDPAGNICPRFPKATYYVQRREYEDAMHPNERTKATYFPINYDPLVQSGQMMLLDGDTEIVPGIRGVITPGHTPAHQAILFESAGQQALFVADFASYAIHFERLGWMTAYDVEPLVSLETKRRWQQWALDTHGLLIFQHDTQIPAGRLIEDDQGHRKIDPVPVELA